jgi:hypothetical protein
MWDCCSSEPEQGVYGCVLAFTYRRIESMSQNLHDRLGDSQVTDVRPLQSQADISLDKDRLEAFGRQVAILEDRIRVLEETCAAKEGAKEGADKASQEFRCEIAVLQTQNKASRGKFGTHLFGDEPKVFSDPTSAITIRKRASGN